MFTMSNINNLYEMSDLALVRLIGKEIQRIRLEKNMTQEALSRDAGIDRSFLSQVENGRPTSILILIQILRVLQRLDLLVNFSEEPVVSPMMVAKIEKDKRVRARGKSPDKNKNSSSW
jgi:putative transcriptional regulator